MLVCIKTGSGLVQYLDGGARPKVSPFVTRPTLLCTAFGYTIASKYAGKSLRSHSAARAVPY